MSKIRLYLDEDTIKAALVKALRNADLDIITVADVGRLGYSDEEQLIWAKEQARVIYSFNIGDFCRLHHDFIVQAKSHAGIILAFQQHFSIGQQLRGLLKLAAENSVEDMTNQLIFLSTYIDLA
ncbi:DUF5615 family PIN-like protein [Chlorogloeopsis sp. ULAP01]|uniref:DUF5615 family PIN-like protein n=1 Tax=Chlorogloeopsis sp. ULAP01 TaxID=3056483 RepID=UPI0025AB115D|nr:DUF5615 family PIN-like protein [Chlorogloeopsis sp. ULAP01]MDM9382572.1 DUF5615 family PIN-like protein [Chlorogloeopsis sp. ULAP01]